MVLFGGAIVLLVGVIAMMVPVSITKGDGGAIGCGNAVMENLSDARAANNSSIAGIPVLNEVIPHEDFVGRCQAAVSDRRTWSIPVAVLGLLVCAGSFAVGRTGAVSDPQT